MRALVAPDSFKGTFRATEVAAALRVGLERAGASVDCCPIADGGEGTLETLMQARGGRTETARVRDPLGREIDVAFGVLEDSAVVEMAAASGLALLVDGERDPWAASTYGTGQLICAAARTEARRVIVTMGGSATVDGGRGALEAIAYAGGLGDTQLVVLCDVRTPWESSATVYGPQKGANPALVRKLAARLDALAAELPRDPRGIPGTGAAGGLSGALWAVHGALLRPGAPYVLDAVQFNARLRECDAVICGEGRIDSQSVEGKAIAEIAGRALAAAVPLHAVVGCNELDAACAGRLGLRSITEATTIAELEAAGEQLGVTLVRDGKALAGS